MVHDEHANEWVYSGLEAVDDFAKSLFNQDGELFQATLGKHQFARIFAHNRSRFDYFPFVDKIGRFTGKDPDVIFDGSSIICIKVFDKRLIFMDSFRFLPMRLADMPTTFGVSDVAKAFFPYRLNTPELWDKCIPKLEIELYVVSKRTEFLEWYRNAIEEPYMQRLDLVDAGQDVLCTCNIFAENLKYCRDDVKVLRVCFLKFLEACMQTTGIMPGVDNLTTASYCNLVWKAKFLEPGTVGLVPHKGHVHKDTQSKIALSWLKFLDVCHFEVQLEYAGKNQGEHKVLLRGGILKVDGYLSLTNTVFEFYGCEWHGCLSCHSPSTKSLVSGRTIGDLNANTMNREGRLRQAGYKVESIWECEWRRELAEGGTADMYATYVAEDMVSIRDPLDPREGLFGGRVDCYRMLFKSFDHPLLSSDPMVRERLKKLCARYLDVTSLYPHINKNGEYPMGHQTIKRNCALPTTLLLPFFGLVFCRVLPPRDLFHPVLPCRIKSPTSSSCKLMFVLCRKCAEEANFQLNSCVHTDEERAIEGVWTSAEVTLALQEKYTILCVFEVWHYHRRRKGLFADYINAFLKGKQEAAGWPKGCASQEERTKYIDDYENAEMRGWTHRELGRLKTGPCTISTRDVLKVSGESGPKSKIRGKPN